MEYYARCIGGPLAGQWKDAKLPEFVTLGRAPTHPPSRFQVLYEERMGEAKRYIYRWTSFICDGKEYHFWVLENLYSTQTMFDHLLKYYRPDAGEENL